jgi:mono/diheme cytochrome c family protein
MMNLKLIVLILLSSGLLAACNDEVKEKTSPVAEIKPAAEIKTVERNIDPVQYSRGARLYQLNCAKCHGKNAEGTPTWRKTEDDGMFPPPPLNGTGHTWHHPTKVLVNLIKDGTAKIGGKMPAWKDKLSEQEIHDILTWIKAQWSDEIYAAWYTNDQGSK